MKRRYLALPFLVVVIILAVIVQIGSNRLVSPPRAGLTDYHFEILGAPAAHGLAIEELKTRDGTPYLLCRPNGELSEKGRLLREQLARRGKASHFSPRTTLIILHGHGGRKEDSLPIAERFCAVGFDCVLFDLPGHGESPYPRATFGKNEVPLLEKWLPEIASENQLSPRFALLGFSQGGVIALQLAGQSQQELFLIAVTSFSAFANLGETVTRVARENSPVQAALLPLVSWNLNWRDDINLATISPARAASQIQIPTLIIHGAEDRFIPPSCAQTIYERIPNPEKKLILVPEAGHHDPLLKGHELYATMAEFFLEAAIADVDAFSKAPDHRNRPSSRGSISSKSRY